MVWELPSLPHKQWAWLPALLAAAPFRVRMWKNAGDGAACQTGMNPEQWPVAKSNPRSRAVKVRRANPLPLFMQMSALVLS